MNIRKHYHRPLSATLLCLLLCLLFCSLFCSLSDFLVGQTPPPPKVAEAAMNVGIQHLRNEKWQQARNSFDLVLQLAPTYAPAHIGKLCAKLMVTEETLRDECLTAIDEEECFKLALQNAPPAYMRYIQGYADAIKKRNAAIVGNRDKDIHKPGERAVINIVDVDYAFRWCPEGAFPMGSPSDEKERNGNESLQEVSLSQGFWLLETEVTQLMWASVMGDNPSEYKGMKRPVEQVSWNDSQEYIKRLNGLGVAPKGYKFALPTEAQWEYACRADSTMAYCFGADVNKLGDYACNSGNSNRGTNEVGPKPPNAWGLCDMHGNVWEWCSDLYENYPSGAVVESVGASSGTSRVLRGGGWRSNARFCRSASRAGFGPSSRADDLGLRLSLVREKER